MKKKNIIIRVFSGKLLIAGIVCLALAIAVGTTTIALLHEGTDGVTNTFEAGNVNCQIVEALDGQTKTSISVKNTGDVYAYVRVRLVSYWQNAEGQIIGKSSPTLNVALATGWIAGSSNTYYYSSPVAPGETSPSLLSSPLTMIQDDAGNVQVIEVLAESIQSQPARAVTEAWGVTVGDGGTIGGAS